jgi:redox-sensitive bicupin YhaK (pirin superfamily)
VDLHQAFRILALPDDGILPLRDGELAREASPLERVVVAAGSAAVEPMTESVEIRAVDLGPGKHVEVPVPAWSACALAVLDGFCLTGIDGESPDAHAGQCVVYRRRNRDSAVILVAGPDGCRATLAIAAGTDPSRAAD